MLFPAPEFDLRSTVQYCAGHESTYERLDSEKLPCTKWRDGATGQRPVLSTLDLGVDITVQNVVNCHYLYVSLASVTG